MKCNEIKSARKITNTQLQVAAIRRTRFIFQMAELTTAVSDEEVVKHFREVIVPYVIETQLTEGLDNNISSPCTQTLAASNKGRSKFLSRQDFLDRFTDILERTMQGLTKKEVNTKMAVST